MADFNLEGPTWTIPNRTVTWSIASANYADRNYQFATFLPAAFENDLQAAFTKWASVADINFTEVPDSDSSDIRFGFNPIDGVNNTLGITQYSYFNTSTSSQIFDIADIEFDSQEGWTQTNGREVSSGGFPLYAVALHEIGHALGLAHYSDGLAIMNPSISVRDLTSSDIDGIKALYGVRLTAPTGPAPLVPTPGAPVIATARSGSATSSGSGPSSAFGVDGSGGVQNLVGTGAINFINTIAAFGTGTVLVDLKDGYAARGSRLDAHLANIQGVQLGAATSAVLGLTGGTDFFYGGAGDVSFYNEGATDYIKGGTGRNNVVAGAGTSLFYGTGGVDVMKGNTGVSFMQAGPTAGSSDTFFGAGGTDYVYGGPGATVLYGGSGTEDLTGGAGYNELIGSNTGAGYDIMNAGGGVNVFYAGIGTNLLYESDGTSVLAGNKGTDFIYGGAGRSFVYGGSGTDVIATGAGNQYVQAGSGTTLFQDTAAHLTAGRFDQIDNFAGGGGTTLYLPSAAQGATTFVAQNGGTAVLTTVATGTAEIFASSIDIQTVQTHTYFTL